MIFTIDKDHIIQVFVGHITQFWRPYVAKKKEKMLCMYESSCVFWIKIGNSQIMSTQNMREVYFLHNNISKY
jgi:hypothetical protein